MELNDLVDYTGQLLEAARFRDYCPNGLQVEGGAQVNTLVTGVTASMALLESAADLGADAILVHHGWFWKSDDSRVVGIRRNRLRFLLERDISLIAYHLPLDAHGELGNNAQLARSMQWEILGRFGEQEIGFVGKPSVIDHCRVSDIVLKIEKVLGRAPMLVGEPGQQIRRVAWCSGAAQGMFEQAIAAGADLFVTGEVSEQTVHLARESGVAFISAGHHATERLGVKALGQHLSAHFGLRHEFIDINNPV